MLRSPVSDDVIVSINLDQKPNGGGWGRERRAEVRLRSGKGQTLRRPIRDSRNVQLDNLFDTTAEARPRETH